MMNEIIDTCPFCNLKDRVLKSNNLAQAFLSNPRKVPGHFLVTPIRHLEKPWEITNEELLAVFELIFFIEKKLIKQIGEGVDIRQNYRPFIENNNLKQSHLQFHVYPRYNEDYLYLTAEKYENDLFTEIDPSENDEFARLLNEPD